MNPSDTDTATRLRALAANRIATEREARAAAIEECGKACADEAERWNGRSADRFWEATRLEGKMRALLSAPEPTQETER